jgi:transcriptional regulator with XRE-family HTH domain
MTTTTNKTMLNVRTIRREKGLTLEEVAKEAGFPSATSLYLFEIGAIVDTHTKEKIIGALSRLTGQPYSLSDVEFGSAVEVHAPLSSPISRVF